MKLPSVAFVICLAIPGCTADQERVLAPIEDPSSVPILGEQRADRAPGDHSFSIPDDLRAMSILIDSATVAVLRPGTFVDVLLVRREATEFSAETILQRVAVQHVHLEQGHSGSVVLLLRPYDAQRVALALDLGKIHLAVRPLHESDTTTVLSKTKMLIGKRLE